MQCSVETLTGSPWAKLNREEDEGQDALPEPILGGC